ncbi:MAG: hypothetical protein ACRDVF_01640 [Microbacterium sp.]|uniref:hypothetical protein n=1 Tax=Microbacterium sp. TaxID=51671 RepID=UPI003D6E67B1
MVALSPPILLLAQTGGTTDAAPWWGVPVIAGVFLLLGAVVGYFFNRLQDDRRAKREKLERWDQNLLNYTSTVMTMTRQLIEDSADHESVLSTLSELAVHQMNVGEQVDPPPLSEASGQSFYESFDALMSETSSLQLIAPEAVREAVGSLQQAAAGLYFATNPLARPENINLLHTSSAALEKAVRQHFDIM